MDKKEVLRHLIDKLPETPWVDIEILDWQPNDDKLPVEYSFADTSSGQVLVANTSKGICYLGLIEEGRTAEVLSDFNKRFRHTSCIEKETVLQKQALHFLDGRREEHLTFHLRGTPYQTEIWRRLTRIPSGKVISYSTLGGGAEHSRAAGTANGRNPIFRIIPCHRVVKTDGGFDRYFWGETVKKRLLAKEFAGNAD